MARPHDGEFDPRDDTSTNSTRWSVVLVAGKRDSSASQEALEILCRTYWYPLYAYVRHRVRSADEAQDLTQDFFAQLLDKNYVADARPERGRFRAFLLSALRHFLTNEWHKANAQKRGGGRSVLSLDFVDGEARYALEAADRQTPERLFDQQWTVTLINQVLGLLRDELRATGKGHQFETLKTYLAGVPKGSSYADAATQLDMTEGAVRVTVHRFRQRYRELLREEIAQTVSSEEDVEDEIRSLFATLGG